jgi:hypothetical protein
MFAYTKQLNIVKTLKKKEIEMNISNSLTITTEKSNNSVIDNKLSCWQGIKVVKHIVAGTITGGIMGYIVGQAIDFRIKNTPEKCVKKNCGDLFEDVASPISIALASCFGVCVGVLAAIISYRQEIKQQTQELPINNEKIPLQGIENSIDIV